MKNSIRSELYKVLTNNLFYVSLAIGTMFCLMDVIENQEKMWLFDESLAWVAQSGLRIRTGHEGYSLFHLWMGLYVGTRGALLFYTVWPILAAMAYGWSYIGERRSGVYNQIASRTSAGTYYISKFIAVFVSGGLAVAVPVLLGLLANAMVVPYAEISSSFNVLRNQNFMSGLFYENHWLYAFVWIGVQFLCGGAAASLCFVTGTKLRYGVMVLLTPYALYVALDALLVSLRSTVLSDVELTLSPLKLISAMPGNYNPAWLVFSILGGITGISFLLGYWQVVKHELA